MLQKGAKQKRADDCGAGLWWTARVRVVSAGGETVSHVSLEGDTLQAEAAAEGPEGQACRHAQGPARRPGRLEAN